MSCSKYQTACRITLLSSGLAQDMVSQVDAQSMHTKAERCKITHQVHLKRQRELHLETRGSKRSGKSMVLAMASQFESYESCSCATMSHVATPYPGQGCPPLRPVAQLVVTSTQRADRARSGPQLQRKSARPVQSAIRLPPALLVRQAHQ